MAKTVYFYGSREKHNEITSLFDERKFNNMKLELYTTSLDRKLEELQIKDEQRLVEHKLIKAFEIIRRPVMVEHTFLCIDTLGGFPSGLTQPFWDSLGDDAMLELVGDSTAEKNRIHMILQDANIKLTTYVSDMFGASGRPLLESIVNGEVLERYLKRQVVSLRISRNRYSPTIAAARRGVPGHLPMTRNTPSWVRQESPYKH